MGIIILAIAVLPCLRVGGRGLLQRELPGPSEIEPLGATVRELARRLWKGSHARLTLRLPCFSAS